jgi:hypothetical protein
MAFLSASKIVMCKKKTWYEHLWIVPRLSEMEKNSSNQERRDALLQYGMILVGQLASD